MAQRQVNPDAIAAELRDSQAAHKIQNRMNSQFKHCQNGPKPFLEWLGELETNLNIEKLLPAHLQDQRLRKERNLEMEEFGKWFRKYILEMAQLKRDLESDQANLPIPQTSPQKAEVQDHASELISPQFLQCQSSSKKKPFVWK